MISRSQPQKNDFEIVGTYHAAISLEGSVAEIAVIHDRAVPEFMLNSVSCRSFATDQSRMVPDATCSPS